MFGGGIESVFCNIIHGSVLVRKHRIRNSNFDGGSFFVLNYVTRSPFTDMSFENYGEHL